VRLLGREFGGGLCADEVIPNHAEFGFEGIAIGSWTTDIERELSKNNCVIVILEYLVPIMV